MSEPRFDCLVDTRKELRLGQFVWVGRQRFFVKAILSRLEWEREKAAIPNGISENSMGSVAGPVPANGGIIENHDGPMLYYGIDEVKD